MISANAVLTGSYDCGEVARSILIASTASYAALDLAGRVTVVVAASTGEGTDLKVSARDGRVIDVAADFVHLSDGSSLGIGRAFFTTKPQGIGIGCRSAAPLSSPMEAVCGLSQALKEQIFNLLCPPNN
ncbi:MAG: hypothetical protein ABSD76_15230 [Terriglobales bacterium]|jgi:hypothetical protein